MEFRSLHDYLNEDVDTGAPVNTYVAPPNSVRPDVESTSFDLSMLKNKRALALAGCLVVLAGIVAESSTHQSEHPSQNSEQTNPSNPNAISNGPVSPTTAPNTFAEPTHFNLVFKNIETENGCVQSVQPVDAQVLSVRIRNVRHDVVIKEASVALDTCADKIQTSIVESPVVDKQTNIVPQVVSMNTESLLFGASLLSSSLSIKTLTSADELTNEKTGCKALPVWGCEKGPKAPKAAILTVKEKAQLLQTAELMIAQAAAAQCGPYAYVDARQAIIKPYEQQAVDQNIDPKLIRYKFVDSKGDIDLRQPNYGNGLNEAFAKRGAITDPTKQKKLFGKSKVIVSCKPLQATGTNP